VLRSTEGNRFRLADQDGNLYLAELVIKDKAGFAKILEKIDEDNEMKVKVTIIQALIKGERWDYFLQKATECGVTRIVPFVGERNVVKYDPTTDVKKLDRWRKIVQEAAEQSLRNIVPEVAAPIAMKDLENYLSDANYVAYELEAKTSHELKTMDMKQDSLSVLIGSEGGFSPREIERFQAIGFVPVGLGKRILRAETAAIVALTLIESKSETH
ncbi:MAG: 16S rRNA (uracil(1498)-N(3))-methyltransferase, partial [Erysipelotrichaceae bacterium]